MEPSATARTGAATMGERWELGDELGSGAIARVVRVFDRLSGAHYAAKLLHPRHERDATAMMRFRREAELSSKLVHDNLVRVWGTDTIAGHTALVMELVEGPTLAHLLARGGPLDEPRLLEVAAGLAAGLAYAHGCGVIHRDLKPANVLMGERGPKIADFGMARASSFAEADRGALTVLGTPPYMAPECLDPLAVDPRTDLYALGCILHELATGAPPFTGPTPFAVLEAHRTAAIPRLPDGFGDGTRRLVASLMAKAAGDRPQSAGAVLHAITGLRDPEASSTAIALVGPSAPEIAAGRCAGCGGEILTDVRVCFHCGLVPVVLEPGRESVLVIGPGRVSDKLDSERRDRLVQWLDANARVGFSTARLEHKIPRLPFVLVRGVSATSAQSMVASLARLGITAEASDAPMNHPAMRAHVRRMTARRSTLSAAIVLAPGLIYMPFVIMLAPVAGLAVLASYAVSRMTAGRTTVATSHAPHGSLPAGVGRRLAALPAVVAGIQQRRHREALGAVVRRVLVLTRSCDPDGATATAPELEHAVNLAGVAALRMDDIERTMTQRLFDPAHPEHRALMHERDTWAARLLDLTATLDALTARLLAARGRVELGRTDDALAPLRAQVEALEEVSRS